MEFSQPEEYLIRHDQRLATIMLSNGPLKPRPRKAYFEALSGSIISQQISVKAAASIFTRFCKETSLQPKQVANLNEAQAKAIGLSGQKTKYLKDLAEHFLDNPSVFDHLEQLADDEVIAELTEIKGIGIWTAQMFLMFTLGRPDIFAPGDRGLQLAIIKLYDLPITSRPSEFDVFAARWQPYKTTASMHLWHSLDNAPE